MPGEIKRTDVSHLPDTLRLAEEVRQTRQPQVLKHGEEDLAMLSPVEPESSTRRRGARKRRGDLPGNKSILNLIGLADDATPPDDAADVSSNKHKYLADAYYAEFHPLQEK